jgi:hypothetical protein
MITWRPLSDSIGRFEQFLRAAAPITDWHVVFDMGTVARVNPAETRTFEGFDHANIPLYRLTDPVEEHIAYHVDAMAKRMAILEHTEQTVLETAYQLLIADGYPTRGASDRFPIPLENPAGDDVQQPILWSVVWPQRSPALTNLAIDPLAEHARNVAGELRRLDFIYPRAAALISPGLVVTMCTTM